MWMNAWSLNGNAFSLSQGLQISSSSDFGFRLLTLVGDGSPLIIFLPCWNNFFVSFILLCKQGIWYSLLLITCNDNLTISGNFIVD